MSKVIHEEEQQQQGAAGGAQDKVRKAARQLAYDVRYKVKQGFKDGQKADPNSLKRAYMQQLGKSPAPGPVKALAKKMLIGEEYDFFTIESSLSSVVGKVFTTEEEVVEEVVSDEHSYLQNLDEGEEKKYQIRVKDKKTGKSYVRTATRAKISELRANPNISSVEMTGYGKDYAAPTDGGGKKAKKDYDGDGKVESGTDEYMGSRDKAIKKAMAKEEYIGEVNVEDENPDANEKKIDMMKGKNKVTINPKEGTIVSHNELEGKVISEMDQEPAKEDPGLKAKEKKAEMAKKMVLQKKLQAVRQGAGNEIMASHQVEGDLVEKKEEEDGDERAALQKITMVRNKLRARGMQVAGSPRASDGPRNMKTGPEMNQEGEEVKESNVERAIKMNLADRGVQEEMSMDRRKRAAEIGAKSSSYKTRFAAMKLASGENKPVRGKGNKAAKRAAEVKEAVYGGGQKKELPKPPKDTRMTVTAADKAGNTPAYQRYKAGNKHYKMDEATYPSDFRNPDGSKRAVAKKKDGRPIQHDQPMNGGRRKTVDENRLSDEALEKAAAATQKKHKEQGYKVPGTGAMDDVRARIAAREKK